MGRIPNNNGLGLGGNVCQTFIRCEPLCEQFGEIRPPEFEGSTNPLDAEEWLFPL